MLQFQLVDVRILTLKLYEHMQTVPHIHIKRRERSQMREDSIGISSSKLTNFKILIILQNGNIIKFYGKVDGCHLRLNWTLFEKKEKKNNFEEFWVLSRFWQVHSRCNLKWSVESHSNVNDINCHKVYLIYNILMFYYAIWCAYFMLIDTYFWQMLHVYLSFKFAMFFKRALFVFLFSFACISSYFPFFKCSLSRVITKDLFVDK